MANIIEVGVCCCDCRIAIANDDYTGMTDKRAAEVSAAIEATCAAEGWLIVGDDYDEFSWHSCDICGAGGGERWSFLADADALETGGVA